MSGNAYYRLIKDYMENYMGPVFYYCLRRTGNTFEANDLSQEIALQVWASLKKGTVPEHFSAWIWSITSNCYSKWADRKHKRSELVSDADIDDLDIADDETDLLNTMYDDEQLTLLRRELAFIKNEYREIIVAFYLDDQSVREIAEMLSLTESTVKKRLERARKTMKEGMSMVRTFGKLSYRPENITFINDGLFGSNGEPWNYLERLLCKNMLLAAYRLPSTAEELALELGVALPYMQEELDRLVEATLMKKTGKKYETAFFIVSAYAQEAVFAHLNKIQKALTEAVIDTVEYETVCKNSHRSDWHEGFQPYEDMKWALLMDECDLIGWDAIDHGKESTPLPPFKLGPAGYTVRPNGGEWDILGMETYNGEEPSFVGKHGCVTSPDERDLPPIDFYQYKFQYRGIAQKTPAFLHYSDGQALLAVAQNDISGIPTATLDRLEKEGFVEKKNGIYQPTFLVIIRKKNPELSKEEQAQLKQLRDKAIRIAREHYKFCREQIMKEIPEFLKNDNYQIDRAPATIFSIRGAVLEGALRCGYITYADNDPRRMLGVELSI